jgi:hypothetical protein
LDFLAPIIEQAIAGKGFPKGGIVGKLEDYRKKTGYNPTIPATRQGDGVRPLEQDRVLQGLRAASTTSNPT